MDRRTVPGEPGQAVSATPRADRRGAARPARVCGFRRGLEPHGPAHERPHRQAGTRAMAGPLLRRAGRPRLSPVPVPPDLRMRREQAGRRGLDEYLGFRIVAGWERQSKTSFGTSEGRSAGRSRGFAAPRPVPACRVARRFSSKVRRSGTGRVRLVTTGRSVSGRLPPLLIRGRTTGRPDCFLLHPHACVRQRARRIRIPRGVGRAPVSGGRPGRAPRHGSGRRCSARGSRGRGAAGRQRCAGLPSRSPRGSASRCRVCGGGARGCRQRWHCEITDGLVTAWRSFKNGRSYVYDLRKSASSASPARSAGQPSA